MPQWLAWCRAPSTTATSSAIKSYHPGRLSLRIHECLYFANARYFDDLLIDQVTANPNLTDVVLMCSAVNAIDISALESLEALSIA